MQALIWSKMSTGLPIEISSAMKGQNYVSFCRLDIDIHRYDLIILKDTKLLQSNIYEFHICVYKLSYFYICVYRHVLHDILMFYMKFYALFLEIYIFLMNNFWSIL
jgi:hypothetical protein